MRLYAWIGVLIALVAFAGYAWMIQMTQGLGVTGLNNIIPWGLYVGFFGFLSGIGGGALIVSGAMNLAKVRSYASISRISIVAGALMAVLGSVFIIGDLGRPERAIYFFLSPNLGSSMVWDMLFMIPFILAAAGYGWFSMRADLAKKRSPFTLGINDLSEKSLSRDKMMTKILAAAAVVAGALLSYQASLTSWTLAEHEVVETLSMRLILAPLFLVSAIASGAALLLLVAAIVPKFTDFNISQNTMASLAKTLAVLVALNAAVVVAEIVILDFRGRMLLSVMMEGPFGLAFWAAIVVGAILPILMLAYPGTRRSAPALALASLLSLGGIFIVRLILLLQGRLYPNIAYPYGIPVGSIPQTVWSTVGAYAPTWVELAVSTGALALGALLLTFAMRILPLKQEASAQ